MIHDNTIRLLGQALDTALLRQTAIAHNIANSNTANYKTLEVLVRNPKDLDAETALRPEIRQSDRHSPIDEQIALSVKNATQYRALIRGLNHKLAIMKLATGNRQS